MMSRSGEPAGMAAAENRAWTRMIRIIQRARKQSMRRAHRPPCAPWEDTAQRAEVLRAARALDDTADA